MADRNIFQEDIVIPKIVHQKAELAFSLIRTEDKKLMRKNHIKYAAIAVCAAAAITFGILWSINGFLPSAETSDPTRENLTAQGDTAAEDNDSAAGTDHAAVQEDSAEKESGILSELDRAFTLYVRAAEPSAEDGAEPNTADDAAAPESIALETGKPVAVSVSGNGSKGIVLGTTDQGNPINYCIGLPLLCEGENIETVTYRINNGAFAIVQPKDDSIVTDGVLYDRTIHTGWIGGNYDEEADNDELPNYEQVYYKEFTLDYDRQTDEDTTISIANERPYDAGIFDAVFPSGNSDPSLALTKEKDALNQLLDHTVITCTVRYADGAEQTADILVSCDIVPVHYENEGDYEELRTVLEMLAE